jgi:hypothetical protein
LFDCSPAWVTQPPATWVDQGRIDPGPLDQAALRGSEYLGGVHAAQAAVALADRGADGFDDHGFAHCASCSPVTRSPAGGAGQPARPWRCSG